MIYTANGVVRLWVRQPYLFPSPTAHKSSTKKCFMAKSHLCDKKIANNYLLSHFFIKFAE